MTVPPTPPTPPTLPTPATPATQAVLSTLDVAGLSGPDYRAVLDHMGVEHDPSPGLYLHVAAETPEGSRILELWTDEPGFREFVQERMLPATEAVDVVRETDITVEPLFNLFAPRLGEIPSLHTRPGSVVSVLDVHGLSGLEFRAILDRMGVEDRPEPGLFLHVTTRFDDGYRVIELWDSQANFEAFLQHRLQPATQALHIDRPTDISYLPIRNVFGPRLAELPALVPSLPGGPGTAPTD